MNTPEAERPTADKEFISAAVAVALAQARGTCQRVPDDVFAAIAVAGLTLTIAKLLANSLALPVDRMAEAHWVGNDLVTTVIDQMVSPIVRAPPRVKQRS